MAKEITIQDGAAFMARMLPFLTEGLSMEEAGRAVLARDAALFECFKASPEARQQFSVEVYRRINGPEG